ncbi:hypothetical protein HID58_094626 [Brassica napus]|uniref:Uncharacterized protein n=1 Tax=Brassica napus TaxID=3708 RepID=A0ABQ7X6K1_BRANA|nr:hypothetical protein HID58_094626 [Brassica napus]
MSCAAIARKLTRTTQLWIVQRQYLSRAVSRSFASSSFHMFPSPQHFIEQVLCILKSQAVSLIFSIPMASPPKPSSKNLISTKKWLLWRRV